MADFVAVLKKTLGGLEDPSPEMRERVYDKARATITAKLTAMDPPPPQGVIDRQKQALETAIAEIEMGYAAETPDESSEEDPLADFVSGAAFGKTDTGLRPPPQPEPAAATPSHPPEQPLPPEFTVQPTAAHEDRSAYDEARQTPESRAEIGARQRAAGGRRGGVGLIVTLIILLILGGAGYAIWQNKEDFARMVGLENFLAGMQADEQTQDMSADTGGEASEAEGTPGAGTETAATPEDTALGETPEKFTQRLLENGTEIDPGPAGGEPKIGEGTSVAAANVSRESDATEPADGGDASDSSTAGGATEQNAGETGAALPDDTALPVGQKAIFYEERTSNQQGSAEEGQVVWSLTQESPGGGLPEEPAIRAEAAIPGKNIQFRMTIRRNADESLPASHIIEMIFLTPDDFGGGKIDNVLRVTFKDSEQAAGKPLLGIPAKISDGFFLLALSDSKAETEANITMMRRLDWLDIPIVYETGRRALITMEKGIPGAKVFDEALKAWAPEDSG